MFFLPLNERCYIRSLLPLISLQDIVPSALEHDTRATDRFSVKVNKVYEMPPILFCKLQNLCIEPKSDKFATL